MGIPVLILGESGSGKSASLRNFKQGEVLVFNVASKPLPFRGKLDTVQQAGYDSIGAGLKQNKYKRYIIDDSQYLLAFELFGRAKETGYGKFTDIAVRFQRMIDYIIRSVPDDVIVYFLHHCERTDDGHIKAKTIGKMLDNQLTVEGLFSIVLMAGVIDGKHRFITQSDGYTTCKSPMGMFEEAIDNDLKFVDDTIRIYYEMTEESKNGEN